MELENLDTLASFTGTRGEAAFYHVPVLVEWEGGHLVGLLVEVLREVALAEEGDANIVQLVQSALEEVTGSLDRMGEHLQKFYSRLDVKFFYDELRPFFSGGKGMEEKGLPQGIVFQKQNGEKIEKKLVGGSAAQSSLFPFLDCMLGVRHEDQTVFKVSNLRYHTRPPNSVVLRLRRAQEMRNYMPGPHRDFLAQLSLHPSLRPFITSHPQDSNLQEAYNTSIRHLRAWRGKHIAVVSKYIVSPARETEKVAHVEKLEVRAEGAEEEREWELQGTGGSALIPFLRQSRDDTFGVGGEG